MKRSLPYIRNHGFVRNSIKFPLFLAFQAFSGHLIEEQKSKIVNFGKNYAVLCFGLMGYASYDQTLFKHEFPAELFL